MIKLMRYTFYREPETKQALVDFISCASVLSMGEECQAFEKAFAKKQGRKHAVLVTSGSSANLVLVQALLNLGRLHKNDRVGFSTLTWPTNVMPLIQLGLIPEAIDATIATLNVSPDTLAPHLDSIRCLFITNALGFADRIDVIRDECAKRNIILLEDNCESLGSKVGETMLGNFGLASTFSFFVGHHLSLIEGGMICTDDDELYQMLLLTRIHGWDRNLTSQGQVALRTQHDVDDFYARYTFYDLAYNARPTEITGVLGNIQLPYWDEIVSKRQANFLKLHQALQQNSDFIPLEVEHMNIISCFAFPFVAKDVATAERYKEKFSQSDVEIRPIIAGDMTRQPFYRKYVPSDTSCEYAKRIHECGFYCGNDPQMTNNEMDILISLVS